MVPTLSPSMDIQVSSNFERLLFDLLDRDGAQVTAAMTEFRDTGKLSLADAAWKRSRELFDAYRVDDELTSDVIRRVHAENEILIDPHTAVGIEAARRKHRDPETPMVSLATAHPAKFPDAVEQATESAPELPASLADLFEREEHYTVLPNQLDLLQEFIRAKRR